MKSRRKTLVDLCILPKHTFLPSAKGMFFFPVVIQMTAKPDPGLTR